MNFENERVKSEILKSRITDADDAVRKYFPHKGVIGFSGSGGCGIPKEIPSALGRYAKETGEDFVYTLMLSGTTTGKFEESMAPVKIKRRYPSVSGRRARAAADSGEIHVVDMWISEYSEAVRDGLSFRVPPESDGYLDMCVIEATGITEDGHIILSEYVGQAPAYVQVCRKLIIEVNQAKPYLYGLHDIYYPDRERPIPITEVNSRVGTYGIPCQESKIKAIVYTNDTDDTSGNYQPPSETDRKIASNIASFLKEEVKRNPLLRDNKIVMQNGAGAITNELSNYIEDAVDISRLSTWSEVASAKWISLLGDKLNAISCGAIQALPGEEKYKRDIFERFDELRRKNKLVLRPMEVTNNLDLLHRLKVIAMQHAIEMDIYGNANISHIGGTLYAGVGGSGDFCKAGLITILSMPSTASGKYSRIVPIASHVDIPEHDIDIVVTEHGWADLRGLSPRERASVIIEKCADPKFAGQLQEYYETAKMRSGGHEPVDLRAALKFFEQGKYPILGGSAQ